MAEKQAIFVFGMGRSGTSALARVLSLCGASLPERLMSANEGNPTGYWEPMEAFSLNEEFLFRHGATWYDPTLRLQGEVAVDDRERGAYVERIRAFLEACPSERPLVLKEPRITALSDFWFEAARQAGFTLKVVLPVRHPAEVAASLASRDQATLELSSALWLKYNLLAERKSRGLPRLFVNYANLLRDWRKEIGRISHALSVGLDERDEAAVDTFLSDALHRERRTGPPVEVFGQAWIGPVYTALSAAAKDTALNLEVMDDVFSQYAAAERGFRIASNEFRTRFGGLASASDLATLLVQGHGQCAIEIAARFGDVLDLGGAPVEAVLTAFTQQADRVSGVVETTRRLQLDREAHQGEIARLQVQAVALQAQLASSNTQLVSLSRERSDLRAQIAALEAQVAVYEHSRSWRLTAPLRAARRLGRSKR